jgi:hypothetical protein
VLPPTPQTASFPPALISCPLTRRFAEAPDPLFKTVVNVRHVTPIEKLTRAPLAIWTPDELARAARLDDADDGREQPE